MNYELWNTKTRNAIGEYATEAEALAFVREVIARHGRSYADMLFLGCEDSEGRSRPIAKGQVLVERALAAGSQAFAASV